MENYTLQDNEVVLFEDDVRIPNNQAFNHLILTNINLVIVSTIRKMFKKDEVSITSFPITEIKIYNDSPQVIQQKDSVTVFFSFGELTFNFESLFKATKFANKTIGLITGKNTATRGADKVKSALGLVDNTLGINTIGAISGVLENGIGRTLLNGVKRPKENSPNTSKTIDGVAGTASAVIRTVISDKPQNLVETPTALSYDQRVESVKKLKDLLDMGILSQEEFDKKKKELLDL